MIRGDTLMALSCGPALIRSNSLSRARAVVGDFIERDIVLLERDRVAPDKAGPRWLSRIILSAAPTRRGFMKSDKTNKLRRAIIMRGVARRSRRRRLQGGSYQPNKEETAEMLHRQRADREEAISNTMAAGDWVRISELARDWARERKWTLRKARREVCHWIERDSAEDRLGTEGSPALKLLSKEYNDTPMPPSALVRTIEIAFDGMNGKDKDRAITTFLIDHCWINLAAAAQYRCKPTLPSAKKAVRAAPKGAPARPRGRPLQFDWEAVRVWAKSEFDHRGDFLLPENRTDGWRSQADFERLIQDAFANDPTVKRIPEQNTVRTHLTKWLRKWRSELANK